MSDMVEIMARSIAAALGDDFDRAFNNKSEWNAARGGEPFRDINLPYKGDYIDAATAALKAMRVPTEAMVEAGAKAAWQTGIVWDSRVTWEVVPDFAKDYWRDKFRCAHIGMIDAAIEGRER